MLCAACGSNTENRSTKLRAAVCSAQCSSAAKSKFAQLDASSPVVALLKAEPALVMLSSGDAHRSISDLRLPSGRYSVRRSIAEPLQRHIAAELSAGRMSQPIGIGPDDDDDAAALTGPGKKTAVDSARANVAARADALAADAPAPWLRSMLAEFEAKAEEENRRYVAERDAKAKKQIQLDAPIQPAQPAPSTKSFTVERVSVPQHWRVLPVHDVSRVIAITRSTIRSYLKVEKQIGSGEYGDVYAVRLVNPDSCSAFAGLSTTETYALKVESILSYTYMTMLAEDDHMSAVVELEANILMRRVGIDMVHFVPLLAWTRWYVESDGINADDESSFPAQYDKGYIQLMLFRYVPGMTMRALYGLGQYGQLPDPHPHYTSSWTSSYSDLPLISKMALTISSNTVQILCALHMLRTSGIDLFLHRDLHPGNIMFSTPAEERPPQFLLYSGTGTHTGTQKMFVVPLAPTGGQILRILDMGDSTMCYDYKTATSTSRHCTYPYSDDQVLKNDIQRIWDVMFTKVVSLHTAEFQREFLALPYVKQLKDILDADLANRAVLKRPDYYLHLLERLDIARSFRVGTEKELEDAIKWFGKTYQTDATYYTRALAEGRYRMVNMPMTAGRMILQATPVND
jgi:serine/threonine protein kinase